MLQVLAELVLKRRCMHALESSKRVPAQTLTSRTCKKLPKKFAELDEFTVILLQYQSESFLRHSFVVSDKNEFLNFKRLYS